VGQRRLAHAASDAERDQTARDVLGNIRAMQQAVLLATEPRPFSLADLLAIHRTLLEGGRDERLGGAVREEQNWIGGQAFSPAGAAFVPPPPEAVPELLEDLVRFVNRADSAGRWSTSRRTAASRRGWPSRSSQSACSAATRLASRRASRTAVRVVPAKNRHHSSGSAPRHAPRART
jgi:hypothetical protein